MTPRDQWTKVNVDQAMLQLWTADQALLKHRVLWLCEQLWQDGKMPVYKGSLLAPPRNVS